MKRIRKRSCVGPLGEICMFITLPFKFLQGMGGPKQGPSQ
jgi:hypothetical protein